MSENYTEVYAVYFKTNIPVPGGNNRLDHPEINERFNGVEIKHKDVRFFIPWDNISYIEYLSPPPVPEGAFTP